MRRANLTRVLTIVMDQAGPFTRAELIEATGLSAPTVGSLVAHLIREGAVNDLGAGPSRGGRRPSFMEFNARYGSIGAIDLGPTRTRLAVGDLRGERLAHRVIPTPTGLAPDVLIARIAEALRTLLKETRMPGDRLLAVGAGAPGTVDRERGLVVAATNLKGWTNVPMRDILRRELAAPVVLENDVNLAVMGEHWKGAARGHDTCAFISVGTGIGAGILVEGHLHRGHHFLAGEIAQMCMGPQFVERDFRPRGCLETLAGLKALAARWPPAARGAPEQWLADLFQAARQGDGQALAAVEETARLIGIAVANISAVLDPSLIVLGGAVVVQGEPFVQQEVRRILGHVVPAPIDIVVSALGKDAPLWGSLLVAATEARTQLRYRLREARASV